MTEDNNRARALTTVIGPVLTEADLGVTITAVPNPVQVGNQLSYTLTVTNQGPAAATGLLLTNVLPTGVDFISASGGRSPVERVLVFQVGNLDAGVGVELFVVVKASTAGAITSVARVAGDQTDPKPDNNTAVATTTANPLSPAGADLAVTIAATPNPVLVGSNLTYTVTVTNNGPTAATGVLLTNVLPTGVDSVSASGGRSPVEGVLVFQVGNLDAGAEVELFVVVKASTAGAITSVARVAGDQTDPNPGNNTVVASTTVQSPVVVTDLVAEVVSPLTLNRQTGLFEQQVKVSNGTANDVAALRLRLGNIATNVVPYNASGKTEQGNWFVLYNQALADGETVEFLLEYRRGRSPTRQRAWLPG